MSEEQRMKVLVWIVAIILMLVSISGLLNSMNKKVLDREERTTDFFIGLVSFIVLVVLASFKF